MENLLTGEKYIRDPSKFRSKGAKCYVTLQRLQKIGAVHLIKSYGGEGRKYLKVPRIKYLVLPKCRTNKYQKVGLNTNLV